MYPTVFFYVVWNAVDTLHCICNFAYRYRISLSLSALVSPRLTKLIFRISSATESSDVSAEKRGDKPEKDSTEEQEKPTIEEPKSEEPMQQEEKQPSEASGEEQQEQVEE